MQTQNYRTSNRRFAIKEGYLCNLRPQYYECKPDSELIYQPEIYQLALDTVKVAHAPVLIDIGCGCAQKLLPLQNGSVTVIGLDYGLNIARCRSNYPQGTWIEIDLEAIRPDILPLSLVTDAVVIAADVIEHLVDPTALVVTLKRWSQFAQATYISTPERDLVRGSDHFGPPPNLCHVREWNQEEFQQYLSINGLEIDELSLTRSINTAPEKHTLTAVIRSKPTHSN